jgi:hypothetical protein
MKADDLERETRETRTGFRIAWAVAAAGFLAQMLWNGRYGYFRDELYYLAASDHLAFGYVDFAPLIAWLTHISRVVFGESLHAIRLLPIIITGATAATPGSESSCSIGAEKRPRNGVKAWRKVP